jgi:hypothetical protein
VFIKELLIVPPVCAVVLSPVTFAFGDAVQEYVDGIFDVRAKAKGIPLQTLVVEALVIDGFGLTITVTVCGVPAHPPVIAVGVTV